MQQPVVVLPTYSTIHKFPPGLIRKKPSKVKFRAARLAFHFGQQLDHSDVNSENWLIHRTSVMFSVGVKNFSGFHNHSASFVDKEVGGMGVRSK